MKKLDQEGVNGYGVLSKELLVTAPVMVVLYHVVFGAAPIRKTLRRNWDLYLGLAATWIILALLLRSDPRSGTVGFGCGIDALDYLCTQAGVILHYLRLALWPSPLVICYDDWPIVTTFADCWTRWCSWSRTWTSQHGSRGRALRRPTPIR